MLSKLVTPEVLQHVVHLRGVSASPPPSPRCLPACRPPTHHASSPPTCLLAVARPPATSPQPACLPTAPARLIGPRPLSRRGLPATSPSLPNFAGGWGPRGQPVAAASPPEPASPRPALRRRHKGRPRLPRQASTPQPGAMIYVICVKNLYFFLKYVINLTYISLLSAIYRNNL